ncbi:LOW QUALITY PROTEIN: hypothetical protein Cgig2_021094 [Carnegiea gigantea]|uniref:Uncharacterized protein n=1 Tax=Carnegiea gigantea TaxID=171969 RepID=A0A9Q1K1K2_9CARY|nr:LOW QUALITY PROTEIN: hypothetical protein Cgig2_021094 [Carnegiea gigantea]
MGLPDEDFKFLLSIRALQQQRNAMDLAQAHADLERRDTGAKFYVPPSYYKGEIFSVVEPAAKIEELVDIDQVKALPDQDLTCSSEIAHIEASKLQVKEQEVLREEERICKIREDLTIQHLIKAESKLKSSPDLKKREAEQDLEKEKDHMKILIGSVISFNNV